jgi:myo-inositol-1(or 4)-monophosphatase
LSDRSPDLGLAIELANAAGEIVRGHFRRLEHVERKGPGDVVTEVDFLAEALILDGIRARFPSDRIIAEESGNHPSTSARGDSPPGQRTWFVDPLDGTVNYANGIPFFCVSIALVVDQEPVLGVVLDPTRAELFTAISGGPAMLNGKEIEATVSKAAQDLLVSTDREARGTASETGGSSGSRLLGSAALEICYVAAGRLDAFIQAAHLSNWDVAAAGLIARQAGAALSSIPDGPWFDVERLPGSFGIKVASPAYQAPVIAHVNS